MIKKLIDQAWICLIGIIKNRNTLEIGSLNQIIQVIHRDASHQDEVHFIESVNNFFKIISDFCKGKQQLYGESLALMGLDSIIFNLYSRNKPTDNLRLNNSFYNYNSMSMSQMSVEVSEYSILNNQKNLKKILSFIQAIANSKSLFKKIKYILERNTHKDRNLRFAENLLQTIDYIINKQKLPVEQYRQNKKMLNILDQKRKTDINILGVNAVIFSNQLNKIMTLLAQGSHEEYYALCRIYFISKRKEQRKHFKNIPYSAHEMLYNLHKYYIQSFQSKLQLFQQSKNPLYKLIKCYLACFFMPTFLRFNLIIQSLAQQDYQSAFSFYKSNENVLQKEIGQFIEELPFELIDHLNSLYHEIQKYHKDIQTPSIIPIKRLLLYSFLIQPALIQDVFQQIDFKKYEQVCNYVINLFFSTSIKKFTGAGLTHVQLQSLTKLIESISTKLDERIINFDQCEIEDLMNQEGSSVAYYFIQEPILNHDYEILEKKINSIEFTPKDARVFQMKKDTKTLLKQQDSPNKKQNKRSLQPTEQSQLFDDQSKEEIDLMTWMAVGGTHNYTPGQVKNKRKRQKQQLKMDVLPKQKMKELTRMFNAFEQQMFQF